MNLYFSYRNIEIGLKNKNETLGRQVTLLKIRNDRAKIIKRCSSNRVSPLKGITLAELLISLSILGVIATFTIPKILSSFQNSQYNSSAKEIAASIAAAYHQYVTTNGIKAGTSVASVTPYINYLRVDSTSNIDEWQTGSIRPCNGFYTCLKLHSGGTLLYATSETFPGTNTTDAVYFIYDPDGKTDGTTNGPGKSVLFWLYANGKLTTYGTALANTTFGGGVDGPHTAFDPPWFSW